MSLPAKRPTGTSALPHDGHPGQLMLESSSCPLPAGAYHEISFAFLGLPKYDVNQAQENLEVRA